MYILNLPDSVLRQSLQALNLPTNKLIALGNMQKCSENKRGTRSKSLRSLSVCPPSPVWLQTWAAIASGGAPEGGTVLQGRGSPHSSSSRAR